MKEILFCCLSILLLHPSASAQHEYDVWYFGVNAGLNFNTGNPVLINGGFTEGFEGIACISDYEGNFLFSAVTTVVNKQQQVMDNGNNIHGGGSSTQGDLILPMPGNDSIYFIFTVGAELEYGFQYSVVNMAANAGNGTVFWKNTPVKFSVTEKLTAVRASNGIDYWVIVHGWNNNIFYAYKFNSLGLDTNAVVSNVGQIHGGSVNNAPGYMKASHDGKKLALAVEQDSFFELFDFNDTTGVVSNEILLSFSGGNQAAYGIEFSPDNHKLYGTLFNPGALLQWDISTGNDSIINASVISINGLDIYDDPGCLQLAPDGKIYLSISDKQYLGVIHDPNEAGISCNFVDSGFSIAPGLTKYGLPNIFPGALIIPSSPQSVFSSSATVMCEKFCTDFYDLSLDTPALWQWLFPGGDPSSSTNQNPSGICYSLPGSYGVTLITTNANGSDTFALPDYITVHPAPPVPTITQNGFILTSSPASSYQWQFNSVDIPGATDQYYTVFQSGYYTVIVGDSNACKNSFTDYVLISGINDVMSQTDILVYPNPSPGRLIVKLPDEVNSDEISVDIVSALGQKIYSSRLTVSTADFTKEIDLCDVPPGVYFINIKTRNVVLKKKILITD